MGTAARLRDRPDQPRTDQGMATVLAGCHISTPLGRRFKTYSVEGQGNQGSLMLFDSVPGHQILNKLPAAASEPEAHLALAPGASYHSIRTVS